MRAFGRKDNAAFQALRRGSSPGVEKLEALAEALGLEFYFGPPRDAVLSYHERVELGEYAEFPCMTSI